MFAVKWCHWRGKWWLNYPSVGWKIEWMKPAVKLLITSPLSPWLQCCANMGDVSSDQNLGYLQWRIGGLYYVPRSTGIIISHYRIPIKQSHRIWVWYIYLHENHKQSTIHVGKYTRTMDPIGSLLNNQYFMECHFWVSNVAQPGDFTSPQSHRLGTRATDEWRSFCDLVVGRLPKNITKG